MLNILGIFCKRLHWTTEAPHHFWQIETVQLSHRTTHLPHQHAPAALSCIHKLELEAGPFTLVPAASIRQTTQSADSGLHKMGTSHSWVKMLWKSLHHFNIQLYMSFPTIPKPHECAQVIMEIFFLLNIGTDTIKCLGWCRGAMKAIFLSDISTADGRSNTLYLTQAPQRQDQHSYSQERSPPRKIGITR